MSEPVSIPCRGGKLTISDTALVYEGTVPGARTRNSIARAQIVGMRITSIMPRILGGMSTLEVNHPGGCLRIPNIKEADARHALEVLGF